MIKRKIPSKNPRVIKAALWPWDDSIVVLLQFNNHLRLEFEDWEQDMSVSPEKLIEAPRVCSVPEIPGHSQLHVHVLSSVIVTFLFLCDALNVFNG